MIAEKEFLDQCPKSIYISIENRKAIEQLLEEKTILNPEEKLEKLSVAGEGNMNIVLRIITNQRSFIIKQSRPWVAKYPQITAPIDRINVEAQYINLTTKSEGLRNYSPIVISHLPEHFIIVMEDLGEASDYSDLYQGAELSLEDMHILCHYLDSLHSLKISSFPDNMDMRILNHEHIFNLPFQKNNGLSLDEIQSGLSNIARIVSSDQALVERINLLGKVYLSEKHDNLLHGDFYPASFLKTQDGIKVIDAEFAFLGPEEFDWAVLLAHLILSDQPDSLIDHYKLIFNNRKSIDNELVLGFAGVEILRRLLGVAQLPIDVDIDKKNEWIQCSIKWILNK